MLAKERERRQTELENSIKELAEKVLDDAGVRNISLKLLDIYSGGFRHSYSGFFPLILEFSKDDNPYNLDYLSNNLESVRDYVEKDYVSGEQEFKGIYDQLFKLCDHLNLEIGRWNYYSHNDQKIESIITRTTDLNGELSAARVELEKASNQASSMQTEVIAVLSIFAGIAFVFSGGLSFLGSAISSIAGAEHYEAVILTAIICGIVIFNTIFLLMYLVGKITNRNIYARCETEECTCEKRCYGLKKIRKRLPYVYWFNLFAIIGIIVDCMVWYCDIRNWFFL